MADSVLVFGWGNPSRGDDALGPALIERIAAELPEHALDLEGQDRVLFVDASVSCVSPYAFDRLRPLPGFGYTTHAMQPEALLAVFRQVSGSEPPPAWLLTVRGESFELGEPLSAAAARHLEAATVFVTSLLSGEWQRFD